MKLATGISLLLSLMLSFAGSAQSQGLTAKDLVDGCKVAMAVEDGSADRTYSQDDAVKISMTGGYCYGYLRGFVAGHSAGAYKGGTKHFCLPTGVSTSQIARVLIKRLESQPQFEHFEELPFVLGVMGGRGPASHREMLRSRLNSGV